MNGQVQTKERSPWPRRLALALGPLAAALVSGGVVLLLLGVDPLAYYAAVVQRGLLSPSGFQATLTRTAPLLLLAASLIVSFRAGLWNLGGDGQFLLGAVLAAALAPALAGSMSPALVLLAALAAGAAVGAAWGLVPAFMRAWWGLNEIVTTLMMSFLGASLANLLVKLVFLDPDTTVPQTRTLAVDERLPRLFGTNVHLGLVLGLVAVLGVHFLMTRTAFGLRLRVIGASPRAARHAGLDLPGLTLAVFAISAGLAGLAGAVEVLGNQGNIRADWNPAYSLAVVPLVFLARFDGVATIPFVLLYAVLSIGGESAARRLGVPNDFTLVFVALLLVSLGLAEYADRRLRRRAEA